MTATPKAETMLIGVGPKGVKAWAQCGNTFWAKEVQLRDMYLKGLLDDGCNPRIVPGTKRAPT